MQPPVYALLFVYFSILCHDGFPAAEQHIATLNTMHNQLTIQQSASYSYLQLPSPSVLLTSFADKL